MCCLIEAIRKISKKIDFCGIEALLATIINNQTFMIAQNGHEKMTISGNYGTIKDVVVGSPYPKRVTYSTQQIIKVSENSPSNLVFIDMLNYDFYAIFKQPLNEALPAYFKDGSNNGTPTGFEHDIVDTDGNPILSNQLENGKIYEAKYSGNQIILTL